MDYADAELVNVVLKRSGVFKTSRDFRNQKGFSMRAGERRRKDLAVTRAVRRLIVWLCL